MDRVLANQVQRIHAEQEYFVCQLQAPPGLTTNLIIDLIAKNANLTCHHSQLLRIMQEALSQVLHFRRLFAFFPPLHAFFPPLQVLSFPTQVSFLVPQPLSLLDLQPLFPLIL